MNPRFTLSVFVNLSLLKRITAGLIVALSVGLIAAPLHTVSHATDEAQAHCGIESGNVRIIGNEFPAVRALTDAVQACASEQVEIAVNLTRENKKIHVPALSVTPAEYTSSIVGNAAFVPLLNENLIQPLDDLIKKFDMDLQPSQLVTIDGQTMAIAFLANAQHLFYREDILRKINLPVPINYTEVLRAAELIREQGIMRYPIGATYQAGWNLALEFINLYLATGNSFFKDNSANPNINNADGIKALRMMKALSQYMHPDFLTHGPNEIQAEWASGNIALANLWGSRAAVAIDKEKALSDVVDHTAFAAAPAFGDRQQLATTLWWVGFTLAKNISTQDAEATFLAMKSAMSANILEAHRDKAVWLIKDYVPTPDSKGVVDVVNGNSKPYPMSPSMSLLHTAIGTELVEYMQNKESAEQALSDIESVYRTSAIAAGFIQ